MVVDIKLTHEQHEIMLERLGTEEAIRDWLEVCIDQNIRNSSCVPRYQISRESTDSAIL